MLKFLMLLFCVFSSPAFATNWWVYNEGANECHLVKGDARPERMERLFGCKRQRITPGIIWLDCSLSGLPFCLISYATTKQNCEIGAKALKQVGGGLCPNQ